MANIKRRNDKNKNPENLIFNGEKLETFHLNSGRRSQCLGVGGEREYVKLLNLHLYFNLVYFFH